MARARSSMPRRWTHCWSSSNRVELEFEDCAGLGGQYAVPQRITQMKSGQKPMSGQGGKRRPRAAQPGLTAAQQRQRARPLLFVGIGVVIGLAGAFHFANRPRSGASLNATNPVPGESATTSIQATAYSETNILTNFPPRQLTKEDAPQVINYGNSLLEQGKTKEAILVYQEALKLTPEDEEAHFDLAFAYSRSRQIDAAIKEYTEALRLWPDYPEAHNNLGNILAGRRNYDEAVTHYRAALKTSPEYASALN